MKKPVLPLLTALTFTICSGTAFAEGISVDGIVVGVGADWLRGHTIAFDGEDDRYDSAGYHFLNIEDIDEFKLWIDVQSESLFVAWKTIEPPYPNREYVTDQGDELDDGTFGLLLDLDDDSTTGVSTAFTAGGLPTYAEPVIGVDFGLAWSFRRVGDGELMWRTGRWGSVEGDTTAMRPTHSAAFGSENPDAGDPMNNFWTEAACAFDDLPSGWRQYLRTSATVSAAALLRTPALFEHHIEEITNAGRLLIGWGPVEKHGDVLRTVAVKNRLGIEVVPAGQIVTYDEDKGVFLVGGRVWSSPLAFPRYGDVTGDGQVTTCDVAMILRHILNESDELDPVVADADGDGVIGIGDAIVTLHTAVNTGYRPPAQSGDAASVGSVLTHVLLNDSTYILSGKGTWGQVVAFPETEETRATVTGADVYETHVRGDSTYVAFVASGGGEVRISMRDVSLVRDIGEPELTCTVSPNPCNNRVQFSISGRTTGPVSVTVFAVDGSVMMHRVLQPDETFNRPVVWDLTDQRQRKAGSGVYIVRVSTEQGTAVRRFTIVR